MIAYEAAVLADSEAASAVDRCERELTAARASARRASAARTSASAAAFGTHAGGRRASVPDRAPDSSAGVVVALDELDLVTLRWFCSGHREHWLEGAAVRRMVDGEPLGDAERDLLLSFAGRHGDRWPRTSEVLLRVL